MNRLINDTKLYAAAQASWIGVDMYLAISLCRSIATLELYCSSSQYIELDLLEMKS